MVRRFVLMILCVTPLLAVSQTTDLPSVWNLKSCLKYAKEQNIQLRKSKIELETAKESTLESKSSLFPSLSFSSGQNLVNRPNATGDKTSYTGSYGLNSQVSLYNGGKKRNTIKQMEISEQIADLSVKESENNIELSIVQAYLQLLYANEGVEISKNTVEVSLKQLERTQQLLDAGKISKVDLAKFKSQYSSDLYNLVNARKSLDDMKLQLKQLLELSLEDEINVAIPTLSESDVLVTLPSKIEVYTKSLEIMPEIGGAKLAIESAELSKKIARSGFLPSLNLSAGIGTSHVSGTTTDLGTQLKNSFNESLGLTLSIPIYSNRVNKTAVKQAQLQIESKYLNYTESEKTLQKTVENLWLDANSSQEQYRAAVESLASMTESYNLTQQQYDLGMKNTLDLLTEKNNYLSSQFEVLQSKYTAVMNRLLLCFYCGEEMTLPNDND